MDTRRTGGGDHAELSGPSGPPHDQGVPAGDAYFFARVQ